MALLRQITTVAGGSAAGQLVVLLTTPWLARMYGPAAFGEYAAFLSLCGVFVTVACFRYDTALTAAADEQVAAIFWTACFATLVTAAIGAIVTLTPYGSGLLHGAMGTQGTAPRIATAAVICGLFQLTSAASIRSGRFGWASLLRMLQPTMFAVAALLTPVGLIDSCLVGFAAALPFALVLARRQPRMSVATLRHEAWRAREFPLLSLPTSILDAVSLAMPIWFISARYSSADAGNFAQVQRLLAAPLLLLAIAVGQVYVKRAGDVIRAGNSPRGFQRRIVTYLLCAAGVLLLAVVLLGAPVLHWFLGDGWRTDTLFLLLVFLPVAVRSSISPITGIFALKKRLRLGASWQVLYFGITGLVFFGLAGRAPIEQLLIAYTVSEAVCYGIYLYIADKVAE